MDVQHYPRARDTIGMETSDGRRLYATPAQTIPKEYVFLYSGHIQSFDSRYQELGLVPLSKLQGLVVPLV